MNEFWQQTVDKLIEKAKRKVERDYGDKYEGRLWRDTSINSYLGESYTVRLGVFEGTPCKGYVIANYGTGIVRAYDTRDKRIATYSAEKMIEKGE